MNFRERTTDHDVLAAFPLMAALRDRIREETFLAEVRRQQVEGYRLFEQGIPRVHRDSRITAKGFYEKVSFTMLTSMPCRVDVGNPVLHAGTDTDAEPEEKPAR